MAYLKFNKAELVNLEYSLKRELISSNSSGAYANTTIVGCNTRKYHGLLTVPIDNFNGEKFILLSALDESLIQHGQSFNLGIHCYGDVYEPRGHKYIVNFEMDPIPEITYRVGGMILKKSMVFVKNEDKLLIKYYLEDAHSDTILRLKPFLAFRSIHTLTHANTEANTRYRSIPDGCAFKMYEGFPDLNLQLSKKADYVANPDWYYGITYNEERRRGYECSEDLFVPGYFEMPVKKGETIIFCASTSVCNPELMKRKFTTEVGKTGKRDSFDDCLKVSASQLFAKRNGKLEICTGFSWMGTGILRDTGLCIAGLTLYNDGNTKNFTKVFDDMIEKHLDELYTSSNEVEAPLRLAVNLQHLIDYTGDEKKLWDRYGKVIRTIINSYINGRPEVQLHENGLLWAKKPGVGLTWMNTMHDGKPLTERAGYQVETNAIWYDALEFSIKMEKKHGSDTRFIKKCSGLSQTIRDNFYNVFWVEERHHLADYVDEKGQNAFTRPNQLYACALPYSPVSEDVQADILLSVKQQLVTVRGIRTLSPKNPLYKGVYDGDQSRRELAYHNGSTRPWLLGMYVAANFKLFGVSFIRTAEELIAGFEEDINIHGIGAIAEIYDGDPPHYPHGAINSATGTAEILRVKYMINKYKKEEEAL